MLNELHIENIAVIERADISFSPGLTVLSGETGAGKSIILDSLNAVLGGRTSRDLVRYGAENARVTAVFELKKIPEWLEENDIPCDDGELILQRKISSDGKSTCRVCGVPVTASQMKELGTCLVDIHGQNDGLRLLDEKSHLGFLDSFGELGDAVEAYYGEYRKYTEIRKKIDSLNIDEEEKSRLVDSLAFRISEIEKAELKKGEYEELTSRRDLLRNSEKLTEALNTAIGFLGEGEENAVDLAQNAEYYASRAAAFAGELEASARNLKDAVYSLSDVYETLVDFRDSLEFSPEEYDYLENRIALINRLTRKYSREEDELIDYLDECREKLKSIESSDDEMLYLKKCLEEQRKTCAAEAAKLSALRKASAEKLTERIISELKDLNMPSVRFGVEFEKTESDPGFSRTGCDEVRFVMSANAGEALGRISKIASGGELSRIMLALKNVFAEKDSVETMIFDEVDSGVSGISARRVAEKLWSVSRNKQVMCVSHLPQIAAMADSQYLVVKTERDGRTFTDVNFLDSDGRKKEIARLYGGDVISEKTLDAAGEQLEAAAEYKSEKNNI